MILGRPLSILLHPLKQAFKRHLKLWLVSKLSKHLCRFFLWQSLASPSLCLPAAHMPSSPAVSIAGRPWASSLTSLSFCVLLSKMIYSEWKSSVSRGALRGLNKRKQKSLFILYVPCTVQSTWLSGVVFVGCVFKS